MKSLLLAIACGWAVWILASSESRAQNAAAPTASAAAPTASAAAPRVPVAVVDIPKLFKNHPQFKRQMETIRADVETFERSIQEERKTLGEQSRRQQSLTVGSPEHRGLEETIARQLGDQKVRAQLKRKEVMEREARLYYDVYEDISREVARLAENYGVDLVVRFDSEAIDGGDRNSVLAGVNRSIVYQKNLDLTPLVLQRWNVVADARPRDARSSDGRPAGAPGADLGAGAALRR